MNLYSKEGTAPFLDTCSYPPQYTPQAKGKKDRAASVLFSFSFFYAFLFSSFVYYVCIRQYY